MELQNKKLQNKMMKQEWIEVDPTPGDMMTEKETFDEAVFLYQRNREANRKER